jgi:hypothetical protein
MAKYTREEDDQTCRLKAAAYLAGDGHAFQQKHLMSLAATINTTVA